ncbi:MAG: type II toxin-antitoxin system Phd/YefM family antitoxin, partial [bacterium]|nr:type II toxin-antitoxin system Phd/YefM family antitoxin [bacterium]
MKFVSIRDFRNQTARIRENLAVEHEIVITANGKPIAILAELDEDSLQNRLNALRRECVQRMLNPVRARSTKSEVHQMNMKDV